MFQLHKCDTWVLSSHSLLNAMKHTADWHCHPWWITNFSRMQLCTNCCIYLIFLITNVYFINLLRSAMFVHQPCCITSFSLNSASVSLVIDNPLTESMKPAIKLLLNTGTFKVALPHWVISTSTQFCCSSQQEHIAFRWCVMRWKHETKVRLWPE